MTSDVFPGDAPAGIGVVVVSYGGQNPTALLQTVATQLPGRPVLVVHNPNARGQSLGALHASDATLIDLESNIGYGAAANKALRRFLDDELELAIVLTHDVELSPGCLPELVDAALHRPRFGALGPVLRTPSGDIFSAGGCASAAGFEHRLTVPTADVAEADFVDGSVMLLRIDALRAVGLFDERLFLYAEDAELCARLHTAGWGIGVATAALATQNSRAPQRQHAYAYLTARNGLQYWARRNGRSAFAQGARAAWGPALGSLRVAGGRRTSRDERRSALRRVAATAAGLADGVRGRWGPPPGWVTDGSDIVTPPPPRVPSQTSVIRRSSRQERVLLFAPGPLDPNVADGFHPRYVAFVEALRRSFHVDVVEVFAAPAGEHSRRLRSRLRRRWNLHAQGLPRFSRPVPFDVRDLVRQNDPDTVLVCSPYLAHLALDVPAGVQVVCLLEECLERSPDLIIEGIPRYEAAFAQWGLSLRAGRLYRRLAKRCDVVTLIATEERDLFLERVGGHIADRAVVLRHGIDIEHYEPRPEQDRFDFVVLGRMGSQRNAADSVAVFHHVAQIAHTDALRWAFVGPNPGAALRALRGPTVAVPGEVDDPRTWMASGRVFLAPSSRVTGAKTTVLQALAMGKPVVLHEASARGLDLAGAAVFAKDHADLAAAATHLLSDPAERARLGAAGRRVVEDHYDIRVVAEELIELCSLQPQPSSAAA